MNTYTGMCWPGGRRRVFVNGRPLAARPDLVEHEAARFGWGPDDPPECRERLALAILACEIEDRGLAVTLHRRLAREVLARIKSRVWFLPGRDLRRWIEEPGETLDATEVGVGRLGEVGSRKSELGSRVPTSDRGRGNGLSTRRRMPMGP